MPANRLLMLSPRSAGAPEVWRPWAQAVAQHGWVVQRNARERLWRADPRAAGAKQREAATGRDHRLQRLEAVLFLSREPLTTRKLSQYANLADGTEARTLIRRLNDLYDYSGRAFRVERVAGGYQLLTRPQFAAWVRRLEYVPQETRLSAPALETLAVIAYRQPVLRADIEAIRGVNCGEILRQLMDRELVRIGGRSEELGRPYLYATTRQFLRTFGLDRLEDLPRVEPLRGGGGAGSAEVDEGSRPPVSGPEKAAQKEEESRMPLVTLSDVEREESRPPVPEDELVPPQITAYDEEEEEDDDYDEFYDEDEDEEDEGEEAPGEDLEGEEDLEELDEEDEEEEEFEDEDEWEEVEDEEDSDWDDEDSDWDEDLDEEEEEEDEEWD